MPICLPSFAGTTAPASGGGAFTNQYSVSFDGSDDYMSISDADIFSMGNGSGTDNAFSISAWFNADDISAFYFATKDASGNREWSFRTVSSQLHFFAFGTGGGYIGRKYSTNLSTGQWYHAVVTYDASKASSGIKLYLNGTRADDADYASGTFTASKNTSTEVRVGGLEIGPAYSNGKVDEVAIFNTELSSSDITAIYNSGLPGDLTSLSPVGWWRMGDNDGGTGTTITDQGSGGNDGTLVNGPTFSTDVPRALFSSYSVSFDGSDDYMDVGNITAVNSVANASYSFWYKTSATGVVGLLGGGIGTSAYHWSGGTMYVHSWISASAHAISIPTLGVWHHIVNTFEASGSKLYVDGSLQSTVDHGDTTAASAGNNFAVGKVPHYNILSGQKLIDEVAFFTSTLSASDVTAIYNSGVPGDLTSYSPVGWWRMGDNDGGTGTTITDQGSGGNNGTLTNGPTFSTTVPS